MKNSLLIFAIVILLAGCTAQKKEPMVAQPSTDPSPIVTTAPIMTASPSPEDTVKPTTSPRSSTRPTATVKAATTPTLSISQLPSTYKSDDTRPLTSIDTIVIHTLYNPKYPNDLSIQHAKLVLDESEVSSHFVIARDGKVYQLVPENYQAWQAGESKMPAPDNRTGVNKFSLGIELIATETSGITESQYTSLTSLVASLADKVPIKNILGHSDIAPGRKTDPWKFDWSTWQKSLSAKTSHTFTFYH